MRRLLKSYRCNKGMDLTTSELVLLVGVVLVLNTSLIGSMVPDAHDTIVDYGKFSILIDQDSVPYIEGMTLDFVIEGLNSFFKFINPKETASCGCGVSVNFTV